MSAGRRRRTGTRRACAPSRSRHRWSGTGDGLCWVVSLAVTTTSKCSRRPDGPERHRGRVAALAGHDAEAAAGGLEGAEHRGDPVVAADELVVPAVVVLAVHVVELPGVVGREALHLRHQRLAHAGEDHLVRQHLVEDGPRGEPERLDDQLDRVDHGAVEVEDDGIEAGRIQARRRSRSSSQPARSASSRVSSRS